jgi:hypothetical protein
VLACERAAVPRGARSFVVDALLGLHEESVRRRKEHMRQHAL